MTVLLMALPAVVASAVVLAIADVGAATLYMQLVAMLLAAGVVALQPAVTRWTRGRRVGFLLRVVAVLALMAPMLTAGAPPHRWLPVGPLHLYVAPLVLPALFAALSRRLLREGVSPWDTILDASLPVAWVALHPDASQALAFTVGMAVLFIRSGRSHWSYVAALAAMVAATSYAWQKPDLLRPVPHVEGVFALALGHSWLAGGVVIGAAVALVAGLARVGSLRRPWLLAAAAYYAVLFICSVKGLTPAPIIGYGAGPILGLGLLAAADRAVE